MDPRSDLELLRSGDPDAFAVFYRRHVRSVIALVTRRAEPGDVGDVVAEVFATALVYRRRFDSERGPAGAWLTGIAQNKLADARRRGAVHARMCERLRINRPVLEVEEREPVDGDSAELLAGLPEEQRRAVSARVVGERPYREIAEVERVSEQVIRKRVSRALKALRTRIGEQQ
jgi:RNA polymerase sigma factor (sigma-70 family)